MKAIRIQIEMLYEVPDEKADEIYQRDVSFFNDVIKNEFESWGENVMEPRNPINFELRHIIGSVKDEE